MKEPNIDTLDTIKFRFAVEADLENLIQIHINSFQGYLNTSLGENYVRSMLKWFIKLDSALLLVCYNSEQIIGYAMGAPDGYSVNLQKALLPKMIWGILTHPKFFAHPKFFGQLKIRIRNMFKMKSQLSDEIQLEKQIFRKNDTYTLVGLAISPEFRGTIIIFQLLKEFENHVWAKKFKAIRLTVYKFNKSEMRYERANKEFSKYLLDINNCI